MTPHHSAARRRRWVIAGALTVVLGGTLLAAPAEATGRTVASVDGPAVAASPINDLARTPYQGWNTYYGLGSKFNEQKIEAEADALVDRGLARAGYDYVWIDGGWWNGTRAADGTITPSSTQWPHGMKAVADYIHSRGLKAGIYTDAGADGCGGAEQGSYGHYQQDANTFAAWGFDAVKVDFCGGEKMGLDPATQYGQFRDALLANDSHRPMLFNICNPFVPETGAAPGRSAYDSWKFGPTTGNSWRTDTDIGFVRNVAFRDLLRNLDHDAAHPEAAGPGHWNDPDYLAPELGMTAEESRTQFSMWSVLAAPLIIGSDVSTLSQASIDMLTNREVLAIDQDALGKQGTLLSSDADAQVWVRQLADGSRAVALLNRGEAATRISTTAAAVGLRKAAAYGVRNVWTHTTSESAGGISAAVPAHGTVLLRVSAGIDPETAPPLVTLAPLSVPAAYAGSDLHLAVPGSSFTVTSTLTDEGRLPVSGTDVTVDVPDGWTVAPAATTLVGTIPGGRSHPLSWTVHVPADATQGTESLAVTAHYSWSDGATTHPVTTSTTTGVRVPPPAPTGTADLAHVSWLRATSGWMTPRVDGEVGGGPLRMNGTRYTTGIGVASPSDVEYYLGGRCSRLRATVGIDDATNFDSSGGTVDFQVLTDGRPRADTGVVARPDVRTLDVDITGAQVLTLHVGDAGDGGYNDRADWADTTITCS